MLSIFLKEVNSFFSSLIGYIVISVFLVIMGLVMFVFPDTSYTARIKSLTSSEMVWEIDGFDGLYTKTFKALD